ncbi:FMN-binding protein [Dethiobacter alkaliphilus]|uniref:FMN-binding protein n=1 Tax=Dethiobacter alkaliphilus TaxID=427926 RepID=UPI00222623CB|nr:FMN-binding protein [Dethiobacter alkaliphilus]MCW3490979.1 FMN-binding protein [Dethiobacter alkaliphilus]
MKIFNRRNVLALVLLLAVALVAVGCGNNTDNAGDNNEGNQDNQEQASNQYENGTFTGVSTESRGYVEAQVTIENDEITEVVLTEYTNAAVVKDENYSYEATLPAIEELEAAFVANNSSEVDVVTEATSTSNKAMEAVANALALAEGFDGTFDGTFMGVSEPDDRGAVGIALVTVSGGDIVEVELSEVTGDGDFKDEDYSLDEFHEAVEELPARFVEANSAEVDAYTGATGSSEKWMEAVADALQKANVQ